MKTQKLMKLQVSRLREFNLKLLESLLTRLRERIEFYDIVKVKNDFALFINFLGSIISLVKNDFAYASVTPNRAQHFSNLNSISDEFKECIKLDLIRIV